MEKEIKISLLLLAIIFSLNFYGCSGISGPSEADVLNQVASGSPNYKYDCTNFFKLEVVEKGNIKDNGTLPFRLRLQCQTTQDALFNKPCWTADVVADFYQGEDAMGKKRVWNCSNSRIMSSTPGCKDFQR